MTRSEKKKQHNKKWDKYKLEIIDKFEANIKEFGWQGALTKTDHYIIKMYEKLYPQDRIIILNCANEFSNEFKAELNKKA